MPYPPGYAYNPECACPRCGEPESRHVLRTDAGRPKNLDHSHREESRLRGDESRNERLARLHRLVKEDWQYVEQAWQDRDIDRIQREESRLRGSEAALAAEGDA